MTIASIMVVDDSTVQCDHAVNLCRALLPQASIYFAHNGQQALEQLTENPVSLLLVDLEMPIMDGVELLAQASALKLAEAAIVLSGQDQSLISSVAVMANAQGLKVLGSIQKPLTPELLSQAIKQYDNKTATDAAENGPEARLDITDTDIARAIQNREFICHFQPKLTAKGLIVKGVESLARWQHPEHGFIAPNQFIAIAEQTGMIDKLTFHLYEFSLNYLRQWLNRGLKFGMAFNLSPLSLGAADLQARILSTTKQYQIDPKIITLEITENALIDNLGQTLHTLARLRLAGFNLAIDDYGTGFANAEQLSLIPTTELKLDRSIVNDASVNPQIGTILRSTVNLAKDLNLTTVAEGVEHQSDYQLVRDLGVDLIQGYFFSRPLAADTLINWITSDLKVIREQIVNEQKSN